MGKGLRRTAIMLLTMCGTTLQLSGVATSTSGAAPPSNSGILASTLVNKTGTTITITAGVGRGNSITVRQVGNTIRVRDTGDHIAASGGCTQVSTGEASCGAADTTELVVHAGDQNDNVNSSLAALGVTLIGGAGDDDLRGGSANDTLEGGEGADFLSGGDGNDTLTGGAGADRVSGGGGNDSIEDGAGGDLIDGGAGNDVISGGPGNDQLIAGPGSDFVGGDGGADRIDAVDSVFGNDYVDGGAGRDACSADPGDNVASCP